MTRVLPPRLRHRLKSASLVRRINGSLASPAPPALPSPPALCVLPWSHALVATNGDIHLCCLSLGANRFGNVTQESLTEVFESGSFERVRQQMRNGEWPAECRGCMDRESRGLPSYRHHRNLKDRSLFIQLATNPAAVQPAIQSLDLRLNNICNFKCRSCGSMASNRWFADHKLIYPEEKILQSYQGFDHSQSFWAEFDENILPQLRSLDLAGGEPLLAQSYYRLLEKLIERGKTDTKLTVVSNMSRLNFMNWDAIELWKKFTDLEVCFSLDGAGAKGEYIRHGLNYAKWKENVQRFKRELTHAKRSIHFVISVFNVTDLREHYETIVQGDFVSEGSMSFTFLEWPEYLSVQVLSTGLKAQVERDIRAWLADSTTLPQAVRIQLEALLRFMHEVDGHPVHGNDFAIKTAILDRARGEDAAALFPKLRPMLSLPQTASAPLR